MGRHPSRVFPCRVRLLPWGSGLDFYPLSTVKGGNTMKNQTEKNENSVLPFQGEAGFQRNRPMGEACLVRKMPSSGSRVIKRIRETTILNS